MNSHLMYVCMVRALMMNTLGRQQAQSEAQGAGSELKVLPYNLCSLLLITS